MKKLLKMAGVGGVLSLSIIFNGCSDADLEKVNTVINFLDTITDEDLSDESYGSSFEEESDANEIETYTASEDLTTWVYTGKAWENIEDGKADFTDEELEAALEAYNSADLEDDETYGELDSLGRCTTAYAVVSDKTMPSDKRESISSVKPTGWVNKKYDKTLVEGSYLYNRCHLIGYQLTGENANKLNLITGTRYLNIDGMLDFENEVADYVKSTGKPVLYRVTPVFKGDNLVAHGVRMEGYSLDDNGESVNFDVWAYNVQPGIVIDYATGESELE